MLKFVMLWSNNTGDLIEKFSFSSSGQTEAAPLQDVVLSSVRSFVLFS